MIETVREIIEEHRSLGWKQIYRLAKSDLIRLYRGAALGWAWALVKPIMTLFVFYFGIRVGLRGGHDVNGLPYFLWQLAGFLPWFYMRTLIPGGAGCIRKYGHLVTKMKFPVATIPTFVNIAEMFVHWVLLSLTLITFLLFGCKPDLYLLQLPVYMIMMFLSFTTWGMFAGMLGAMSKDFQNLIRSCSTAIFWMSGVIYDVNGIHNHYIRTLLKLNPVTFISSGYRNVFIYKQWITEDRIGLACYFISLIATSVGAVWAYKKLRKEIPDVL
jgi:teichoic acid transport system permease protein